MTQYVLGYDIGSSAIKAALIEVDTGRLLASATSPRTELSIQAPKPGARFDGIDFNIHTRAHVLRAAKEGIVFALQDGLQMMRSMGIKTLTVRAGKANLFLSPLFCEAFATLTGVRVELYDTDGAQGAARAAGFGAGIYKKRCRFLAGSTRFASH